jgi:hypothetical protein
MKKNVVYLEYGIQNFLLKLIEAHKLPVMIFTKEYPIALLLIKERIHCITPTKTITKLLPINENKIMNYFSEYYVLILLKKYEL